MRISPFLLAAAAISMAFAVETQFWTLESAGDYDKATVKGLSVRNDGRITLAPAVRELHDPSTSYLWAIARDSKGVIYTGGGSPGATAAKLYAITASGVKTLAELTGLQIQAIAVDRQNRVYAATAPDGKVYRVSENGQSEVFYDPKTKYIWSLSFDTAGNLYVATGDHGEIHKVTPAGQGSVFFRTEEEHARSMAIDSSGNLIVGTEPGGLVMRITPAGEGFVLHQTGHREVTAVMVAPDGSIYAAAVGNKPPATTPPPPPMTLPPTSVSVTAIGAAAQAPRAPAGPPTLVPSSVIGGSEVFRIAPDGFPSRVWGDGSEIVYAITIDKQGHPILGTGNRGVLYRIDNDLIATKLVTLNPTQVTALTADATGAIYAATGNIGKAFKIGPELETTGTVESETLDAGWFSEWGRLEAKSSGSVKFETRSGNLDRPQKNWSPWAAAAGRVTSPAARFLQYRATLTGSNAALTSTEIAYLPRNVAPKIERIEITPANYRFPIPSVPGSAASTLTLSGMSASPPGGSGTPSSDPGSVTMTYVKGQIGARWSAADRNGDTLQYGIEIRGRGEQAWKPLKEKHNLRQYSWDSTAFADGEYQLRVTATDALSNAPGKGLTDALESDFFVVDNTPPAITRLEAVANGGKIALTLSAKDSGSILTKAEYSVNGGEWTLIDPTTRLSDARELTYSATIDRPAGPDITVAIRVTDEFDNVVVGKSVVK